MTSRLRRALVTLQRHRELVLPCLVAAILGALVVPLPGWLLDLGLALNLVAAAALLVAALRAAGPLELSAFPTLLLVTTLFRLALNVSSTRLALAEGHAGAVIQAFGEFVVRGDYVVGAVVFAVVTLVQFLVVAKGAERVSEVAARFTLDAMPGKQMAIDADLRTGLIDPGVARERRRSLERESQMFGAMDGAMKFVKGDVLAGLVIVLVNGVGGMLVGMLQRGLDGQEAVARYALIAIGDGLVSQVPSLCIAVAAGLVVTRVAPGEEGQGLGEDIGVQLFGRHGALFLLAGMAGALSLVPGMPRLTFLAVAAALGALGRWWRPSGRSAPEVSETAAPVTAESAAEAAEPAAGVSPLALELAPGWIDGPGGARAFQEALRRMRGALEAELGFRVPGVHVRAGAALPEGAYRVLVDEVPAAAGRLPISGLLVRSAAAELGFLSVEAVAVEDPTTGRPLARVPEPARERLELAGLSPGPPRRWSSSTWRASLAATLRRCSGSRTCSCSSRRSRAASRRSCARCWRRCRSPSSPTSSAVSFTRVSAFAISGASWRRSPRRRWRAMPPCSPSGVARRSPGGSATATRPPERSSPGWWIRRSRRRSGLAPSTVRRHSSPSVSRPLLEAVSALVEDGRAVLLASADVRRPLRALCEGAFPEVAVLAYAELDPALRVKPLGRLSA